MDALMTSSLPTIISEYFAAADRGDLEAILTCFTDDATVLDEDRDWHGHAGIRHWRTQVANAYEYTVDVRRAVDNGAIDDVERHDVYTHLEGNFPGGTVDLMQRFGLRNGRITRLEIFPTEGIES
jgi:hypothetical protein